MTPIAGATYAAPSADVATAADDALVIVHNCTRLGRVANPPRSWLPGWLTPRRGN
ncbi:MULTISPECIES: hypothetical protein [Mycobacteriaceae]|jgi:hypothetical protein|uniref:hypothetical protein n=1 Tax=Mycobacteriaceae TaxID=1762 RepID=UPI000925AFDF|nr:MULTISPECIES: hypothetical protein [Mycolicibacterium]UCZ61988.1 hypothetical protein LHJ73_07285 [Mycolicibacterium phocaicum]SHV58680.1 Uncharacterised protein [Mycobacteroides abscessus subsp. abscessus]